MDIRRRRTRLKLQAALRDLLAETSLGDISVEMLTRHAGVSRPTFYDNYADTTDMLDEYLGGLLDELRKRHETLETGMAEADRFAEMERLVASVFADLDLADSRLRALIEGLPSRMAERRFASLVADMIGRCDPEGQATLAPCQRRIHAHFFTGAFAGLLRLWVGGDIDVTAAALGRAFTELSFHGRAGATALPDNG